MLTQLPTLKSRLAILPTDTTYDPLLTSATQSLSARFNKETIRATPLELPKMGQRQLQKLCRLFGAAGHHVVDGAPH